MNKKPQLNCSLNAINSADLRLMISQKRNPLEIIVINFMHGPCVLQHIIDKYILFILPWIQNKIPNPTSSLQILSIFVYWAEILRSQEIINDDKYIKFPSAWIGGNFFSLASERYLPVIWFLSHGTRRREVIFISLNRFDRSVICTRDACDDFFLTTKPLTSFRFFWLSTNFPTFSRHFPSKNRSNRISAQLNRICFGRFSIIACFTDKKWLWTWYHLKYVRMCISMHTQTIAHIHNEQEYGVGAMCAFAFKKHVYKSKYLCTFWSYDTEKTERERGREREAKNEWMRVMVSVAAYH